ncbi:autotransporter secretion outer membrane protein TamA [Rhodovulum imhoffii]|uniref:Autotransporter secretion outer membrane protein TamA n=1 Tax=Rhodovulum imhoffii TaxID=365340 RepID=A0A2T5BVJ7_9RHOB|nr:autotransporter assembly complex family protein [Rhodovulum imhoffii]MBK5932828.1 hypothetical protein [Rhodovulum imhoffii]PTN03603.1 autotransporter secretion outer membrane protein TamA [Rhodovulum imhoffii]
MRFRVICAVLSVFAGLMSPLWAAEVTLSTPGAEKALEKALRTASLTLSTAAETSPAPADFLAAARADYARLLGVLYGQGYYGGDISIRVDGREVADLPPFARLERIGKIALSVRPGPAFRFARARIAPLAPQTDLPEDFAPGERAKSGAIRAAAQAGVEGWRNAGYAKARVAGQDLIVDHRSATMTADLALAPGRKLRFGQLLLKGESRVRPERIRAITGLPTGETFSPVALRKSADRLRRTGAFRSVTLHEVETANPDGTLDITATTADDKRRRIGFGAEYGTDSGVTLSAFWLHRNLLGGAERLRFDAEITGIGGDTGGMDYSLGARLDRPATFTPDTGAYILGEISLEDEPDYKQRDVTLGGGLTHEFSDTLSGSAGILLRYSDIEDDLGKRDLTQLHFPLTLTRDTRNLANDATRGTYLGLEATPFLGLNTSASGARLYADARAYHALGERFVLAGRLQAGSVVNAKTRDVPPDMLFYSGGGGTVRGQPYRSLSIDLGDGKESGGRSFLGLAAELRADIRENIGVVGFLDAGHVGDGALPGENGDWHAGAGLGLRYKTTIGPIRVDVGAPVDGDTGDGVQLYIGIGQAF